MVRLVEVGSGKGKETGEDPTVLAARLERFETMNDCMMELRAWCDALVNIGDSIGEDGINPMSIGLIGSQQQHTLDLMYNELRALVAEARGQPAEE